MAVVALSTEALCLCNQQNSGQSGFSPQANSLLSSRHQLAGLSLKISKAQRIKGLSAAASGVRSALSTETEDGQEVKSFNGLAKQEVFQFVKYHGLGNDFLLVDNRDSGTPKITPKQALALCNRSFGVGGDGVIFVLPGTNGSDYTMRIYNSDGSEPEMCGNGIRCMARFVAELEGTTESKSRDISTLGGLIVPRLQDDGQVCVDMGPPILEAGKMPTTLSPSKDGAVVKVPLSVDGKIWNVTCVSMGNPHCITILDDTESNGLQYIQIGAFPCLTAEVVISAPSHVLDDLSLSSIGPLFEHHEVFPARTNTEFIQVLSRSHIRMRVWERGAGATLACGTGACALVVAAVLEGRAERKCLVELLGGPLQIEWREDGSDLYMTGPAQKVFAGTAEVFSKGGVSVKSQRRKRNGAVGTRRGGVVVMSVSAGSTAIEDARREGLDKEKEVTNFTLSKTEMVTPQDWHTRLWSKWRIWHPVFAASPSLLNGLESM